jgi:hypothetical protein
MNENNDKFENLYQQESDLMQIIVDEISMQV